MLYVGETVDKLIYRDHCKRSENGQIMAEKHFKFKMSVKTAILLNSNITGHNKYASKFV